MKISKEIIEIINAAVGKAVKESIAKISERNKKEQEEEQGRERNYFRDTEKLLYAYPDLKANVKQHEADIEELIKIEFPYHAKLGKSKDIVSIPIGGQQDEYTKLDERIKSKRANMETTKREIARIDNALEIIKWRDKEKKIEDLYYEIIPLKYFCGMKEEEIAEMDNLKCNPSTIYRNKSRLVNRLKNILFGADALPK